MGFNFEHSLVDSWKPENKGDVISGEIFIMEEKPINKDYVPSIELVDSEGVPFQVLMSQYALQKVFYNDLVVEGGFLAIQYDGESKTIQNAGNFAKKFSVAYYAPGDWSYDDNGEFHGNPTRLRKSTKSAKPAKPEASKPVDYKDIPRDEDDKPFDPETPEASSNKGTRKKTAKK